LLEDGGILVFARQDPDAPVRQQLVKLMRNGSESESICDAPCRMQAILPGLARAL
jgi:hypothetical protein